VGNGNDSSAPGSGYFQLIPYGIADEVARGASFRLILRADEDGAFVRYAIDFLKGIGMQPFVVYNAICIAVGAAQDDGMPGGSRCKRMPVMGIGKVSPFFQEKIEPAFAKMFAEPLQIIVA